MAQGENISQPNQPRQPGCVALAEKVEIWEMFRSVSSTCLHPCGLVYCVCTQFTHKECALPYISDYDKRTHPHQRLRMHNYIRDAYDYHACHYCTVTGSLLRKYVTYGGSDVNIGD